MVEEESYCLPVMVFNTGIMKYITKTFFLIIIFSYAWWLFSCATKNPKVVIKTEFGPIIVELYPDKAPITTTNFITYIKENRFENSNFYRTVKLDNQPDNVIKIEVIQGGIDLSHPERMRNPIGHESTGETGILHKNGVISMARLEPGTASSEFFICVGDQPELDFHGRRNPDGQGFAAFGKVIKGMEIVRRIHVSPDTLQILSPPVEIENIVMMNEKSLMPH